jgi:hypothetical protein
VYARVRGPYADPRDLGASTRAVEWVRVAPISKKVASRGKRGPARVLTL